MDYRKHYNLLIERGKNRSINGYTESHHIIPRCLGGSDNKSNLVDLTPEEHYVAHQLLAKIYPDNYSLILAIVMMTANRPSNKMYGWIRRKTAKVMSELQKGEANNQYGTRWIHNKKLQKSKRIKRDAVLPDGWEEGRIINFVKKPTKRDLKRQRNKILNEQKEKEHIELLKPLYKRYKDGESLRNIAKDYEYSHVTLRSNFLKYFEGL